MDINCLFLARIVLKKLGIFSLDKMLEVIMAFVCFQNKKWAGEQYALTYLCFSFNWGDKTVLIYLRDNPDTVWST